MNLPFMEKTYCECPTSVYGDIHVIINNLDMQMCDRCNRPIASTAIEPERGDIQT